MLRRSLLSCACLTIAACASAPQHASAPPAAAPTVTYDLVIRGGTIYDGSGGAAIKADLGVDGDRVVAIGDLHAAKARLDVDAHGQAVAPGFVNMLSWAPDSLMVDARSLSDLKQGVTLEVFGEGWSYGPLNAAMKAEQLKEQSDIKYDITWDTLGQFLDQLVTRGVTPNVASFVGATTVRQYVLGNANRAPDAAELKSMQDLVRQAMGEGAWGVGSSLIYAPAAYAKTPELTALVAAAAESHGGYISHMRSEGDRLLEALDELIGIARATGAHAEVYHMKAAGKANWPKFEQALAKIEKARAEGLGVSANMYSYTAGATGLDACMDPAVQEGSRDAWIARLQEPKVRARVVAEMRAPGKGWENLCFGAGSADKILFLGFDQEKLKPLTGKTLADVAKLRGKSPEETVVDLIVEDHSRVDTAFFLMSEENVKLGLSQPWVSLGSDEGSYAPEGVFLKRQPHPRAYGTFVRFLGRYVRDGHVDGLEDAVRRLSALPADNWKIPHRGHLLPGYYADIVVFDPAKLSDPATYDRPQQFATGVRDVFVNGQQVLRDGEPTGAKPGRVVRGPGYRPAQ